MLQLSSAARKPRPVKRQRQESTTSNSVSSIVLYRWLCTAVATTHLNRIYYRFNHFCYQLPGIGSMNFSRINKIVFEILRGFKNHSPILNSCIHSMIHISYSLCRNLLLTWTHRRATVVLLEPMCLGQITASLQLPRHGFQGG